jgi:hypothetical protein
MSNITRFQEQSTNYPTNPNNQPGSDQQQRIDQVAKRELACPIEIKKNPHTEAYTPPPYYSILEKDPLSDESKEKIKNFVESFLLTDEKIEYQDWGQNCTRVGKVLESKDLSRQYEMNKALTKSYDSFDPPALELAKEAMTPEKFTFFRNAVKDPSFAAKELGINPDSPQEVFAARMFMKELFNYGIRTNRCLGDVHGRYVLKMASYRGRDYNQKTISGKNKLMMNGDTLAKPIVGTPSRPVDVLMANTYFKEPKMVQTSTSTSASGERTKTEETFGPSREEAREIMKEEFEKLAVAPHTKHVIEALGTLIAKEKGQLLFSSVPYGVGDIGASYGATSTVLGGTGGFYNNNHTIVMPSMINAFDSTVIYGHAGTLIHESLHFLFNRIVGNQSSPAKTDSEQEKLLDQAIELDRKHRQDVGQKSLSRGGHRVWHTFVTQLEQDACYFHGQEYNPSNPGHQTTMRAEGIVRIMEQLAEGRTEAEIQEVAPNLFKYYFEYCKPMLEQYTQDNAHLFA